MGPRTLEVVALPVLSLDARSRFEADVGRGAAPEALPWVADLSLGSVRAHHAARQLIEALGLRWPLGQPRSLKTADPGGFPSYADISGAGIDSEALGTRAVREGFLLAHRCAPALERSDRPVWLVPPLAGLTWAAEDVAFVRFLAQALPAGRVAIWSRQSDVPPAGLTWQPLRCAAAVAHEETVAEAWRLVPTTIGAQLRRLLEEHLGPAGRDALWPCAGGTSWLSPARRRRPHPDDALAFDRIAACAPWAWLRAYAMVHGHTCHIDVALLVRTAWEHFSQGNADVAIRWIDRAVACVPEAAAREVLRTQALGMRIAAQRFEEVADAAPPDASSPTPAQSFLHQARGWGLTMTARSDVACTCFEQARACGGLPEGSREDLYLKNIWAHALRLSRPAQALTIELDIRARLEARSAAGTPPDRRLEYVNAVNLARLQRAQGALEQARHWYQVAFRTQEGLRSDGDLLYREVCLARLDEQRGALRRRSSAT